eukprot:scaffold8124_cov46-Prasinocladus_malaysianus.AAC.1
MPGKEAGSSCTTGSLQSFPPQVASQRQTPLMHFPRLLQSFWHGALPLMAVIDATSPSMVKPTCGAYRTEARLSGSRLSLLAAVRNSIIAMNA